MSLRSNDQSTFPHCHNSIFAGTIKSNVEGRTHPSPQEWDLSLMPTTRVKKASAQRPATDIRLLAGDPQLHQGPGRPPRADAKKNNPDYKVTTVYLRKQVYADAQAKLIRDNALTDKKTTVSDLLSNFLERWVSKGD